MGRHRLPQPGRIPVASSLAEQLEPVVDGVAVAERIARISFGRDVWDRELRFLDIPVLPAHLNSGSAPSAAFLARPVGTGPYRLLETAGPTLDWFDGYHGEKPAIATIRRRTAPDAKTLVNRLVDEVVDLILDVPPEEVERVQSSGVCKLMYYASFRVAGFTYNCRNPALAKKDFRRALSAAADRVGWLESYYHRQGFPVAGPAAPDSWLFDETLEAPRQDLEQTKKLKLRSVGEGPVWLKLIVSAEQPESVLKTCEAFRDALKGADVSVDIAQLDPVSFQKSLENSDFDIACQELRLDWRYDYRPQFASDGARNFGHYQNPALDEVFGSWRIESDFEKVRDLTRQSQRILADDCPWTFLWTLKNIAAANRRIRNIRAENIDPDHFFRFVAWWVSRDTD